MLQNLNTGTTAHHGLQSIIKSNIETHNKYRYNGTNWYAINSSSKSSIFILARIPLTLLLSRIRVAKDPIST